MVIPEGFANCILVFTYSGDAEPMQSAMAVDISDAAGDLEAVGTKFGQTFLDNFQDDLSNQVTLVSVDVVAGQTGSDPLIAVVPFGETGTGTAFPLPPNTAVLIQKRTGVGGRSGRGRMFLPGIQLTGNVQPNGTINGSLVTEYQNDADAWLDSLQAATPSPSIPAYLLHATGTESPHAITSLVVQGKVATQRRRLRP
jgi:hypothetical protein